MSDQVKYLGGNLDCQLNYKKHSSKATFDKLLRNQEHQKVLKQSSSGGTIAGLMHKPSGLCKHDALWFT